MDTSHARQVLAETDISSVHLSHASATASTSTSIVGSHRKGRLSRKKRSFGTGPNGVCASLHSIVVASQAVDRRGLPELPRLALTS